MTIVRESRYISIDICTSVRDTLAYEYAGGKSSPPPVAVDGPGTAEAGPSVEYIAEENVNILGHIHLG